MAMSQTSERVVWAIEALPAEATAADKIRTGLREHIGDLLEYNDYKAAYYRIIDQVPDRVREKYLWHPREYANFWHRLILDGQASGELRPDLDPTILRLQLLGAVMWSLEWYSPGGRKTPEQIADDMAEVFLNGARKSGR